METARKKYIYEEVVKVVCQCLSWEKMVLPADTLEGHMGADSLDIAEIFTSLSDHFKIELEVEKFAETDGTINALASMVMDQIEIQEAGGEEEEL